MLTGETRFWKFLKLTVKLLFGLLTMFSEKVQHTIKHISEQSKENRPLRDILS